MNEYSNSSSGWSREESGPNCAHLFAVYPEHRRTAPPQSEQRISDSAYLRLFQKSTSDATTARQSLVAPASCRRFSAQTLRSPFPCNLRPAQRSTSPISIATPKRLKFTVTYTKQTSRPIFNRYKITGYCEAFVAPASCRRISAPLTSRKIVDKMPTLQRAGGTFLTGTPKQLEITVIYRKQTPASISNWDTNSGSALARSARSSANRLPAGHSLTRLEADASVPRPPIARKTTP
jgi:hypothetical protein